LATINSILVSPSEIPAGGTATVAVNLFLDPGKPEAEATFHVTIDGDSREATLLIHGVPAEVATFSTDPLDADLPGVCVVTVDVGSLVHDGEGLFTYTAP